jgi:hypothetical protein
MRVLKGGKEGMLKYITKMLKPFHSCVQCDEAITNPICTDCLADRMRIMIGEHSKKLAEEVVSVPIDGDTICITCGSRMGLCAHCFSKDVHEDLNEINPILAREFLGRFDFEIRKKLVDFC